MISQIAQVTTINKYMTTANARTPDALKHQIEWKDYFNCLTWFDKHANIAVLVMANKLRNDFNDANTSFSGPGYLTIKQGSVGENVVQWQKILGFTGKDADGKFGPKTRTATIAWQQKNGLTADGIVGPLTWTKALTKPGEIIPSSRYEPIAAVPPKGHASPNIMSAPAARINPTTIKLTPPSSSKKYPANTLHVGSTGPDVSKWQTVVGTKPDGIFGPKTEQATRDWQRKHNLSVTGYVTASDRAASVATPKAPAYVPPIVAPAIAAASAVPGKVIEVAMKMPLWQRIAGGIVTASALFFGYKAYVKK